MTINENDLTNARTAWGEGIIAISQAYEKKGIDQATLVANEMLDNLYGFELGSVLFKPTLSGGNQTFRLDKEGALSYFVGCLLYTSPSPRDTPQSRMPSSA